MLHKSFFGLACQLSRGRAEEAPGMPCFLQTEPVLYKVLDLGFKLLLPVRSTEFAGLPAFRRLRNAYRWLLHTSVFF